MFRLCFFKGVFVRKIMWAVLALVTLLTESVMAQCSCPHNLNYKVNGFSIHILQSSNDGTLCPNWCVIALQLPLQDSLATTMKRLGISNASIRSMKLLKLPANSQLHENLFTGLEAITSLEISEESLETMRNTHDSGFLRPLDRLENLTVSNVPLSETITVPNSIKRLVLHNTEVKLLPKEIRSLNVLEIVSKVTFHVKELPEDLRLMTIKANRTYLPLYTTHKLQSLELHGWVEKHPPLLTQCDYLETLILKAPMLVKLKSGWLEQCTKLDKLILSNAYQLVNIPAKLFHPISIVHTIEIQNSAVETIVEGTFDDAPNLRILKLNNNRIQMLPSNFLKQSRTLQELNLSGNDLTGTDVHALAHLTTDWFKLRLANNTRIGDFCEQNGYSPLHGLTNLTHLDLSGTQVSRICRDWRDDMKLLYKLDLSYTKIADITLEDLQFQRSDKYVLEHLSLKGTSVKLVKASRKDYKNLNSSYIKNKHNLLLIDAEFECDCRMYWLWRILLEIDRVIALQCVSGGDLRFWSEEKLLCARRDECEMLDLPPKLSVCPVTVTSRSSTTSAVFPTDVPDSSTPITANILLQVVLCVVLYRVSI